MHLYTRYLTKSLWKTFLAIFTILILILISNELAHLFSDVGAGDLSVNYVFKIIFFSIPDLSSTLIPVAFFISLILSIGRFWADSEMVVMFASGYTWGKLTQVIMLNALVLSICMGIISLWVMPLANYLKEETISQAEANSIMNVLVPGRFQEIDSGSLVFYLEDKSDKELEDVFIAQMPSKKSRTGDWLILVARYAYIKYKPNDDGLLITLKDGTRYTGKAGTTDYRKVEFEEYRQLYKPEESPVENYDRVLSTTSLLKSGKIGHRMEFEGRLSRPISILILSLIAISLAKVNPRSARGYRLLPAIVIYIIYFNLLTLVQRSVPVGKISPMLGTWWVHTLFLVIGSIWLAYSSGRLSSFISRNV